MFSFIKKYWDIITGVVASLGFAVVVEFKLELIQVCYSVIILILVTIGVLRIVKQAIDKNKQRKERKHNLIDDIVDGQKPVKAIRLAQDPMKDGEKLGTLIITIIGGLKKVMKKLKEFWDKFKGYILTILLAILSVIEMCGGYINDLLGNALTVNGVEILPIITIACTAIVGIISNGYTKEQKEKIKELFSKATTNELVREEIKKTLKESNAQLTQLNKTLATLETDLEHLGGDLQRAKNTYEAKVEMYEMTPQLATLDDVKAAEQAVVNLNGNIEAKTAEINATKTNIDNLNVTIGALKSQL